MILFSEIPNICQGTIVQKHHDGDIDALVIDSRKALGPSNSLFFAIQGTRHDGHHYIGELYNRGWRYFIVEKELDYKKYPEANFIYTPASIATLQSIVAHHRNQFSFPVIGIAGSKGKTIVKEWLYQLLAEEYNCVKSPGSYNSQVGVPLSVWLMNKQHELGIFEAGISEIGEMQHLQNIIQPTIGLITNIDATKDQSLVTEKIILFEEAETIIYCDDHAHIKKSIEALKKPPTRLLSWGCGKEASVCIQFKGLSEAHFSGCFGTFSLTIPFLDAASKENVLHCIVVLLCFKYSPQKIQKKINRLRAIPMRLAWRSGINQCQLIDDTYNNDFDGLPIGLDFLASLGEHQKTVILSDVSHSGKMSEVVFSDIANMIEEKNINKFIGIGKAFYLYRDCFTHLPIEKKFYSSTEAFIEHTNWDDFNNETIFIRGSYNSNFEKIVQCLQQKIHQTIMEVNLDALVHNLNFFKSQLQPGVKLMVMVKAFAYGSGSSEIARILQYHQIDYLGVAHVDEGVALRKHGIETPIMVMNPTEDSFQLLVEHRLEPEIHTLSMLHLLIYYLKGKKCKIHLKIDTGMHRLGIPQEDIPALNPILEAAPNILVVSLFSHLAAADEPQHDQFSIQQAKLLQSVADQLTTKASPRFLHILNSSGILRFPQFQWDMVRLGIGLYGIDPTGTIQDQLEVAITLKTIVLQVKKISQGDTIGYGRKGVAHTDMIMATIAIGYADGFSRNHSEGQGIVLIRGKRVPVIGNVCMDMTMVDVTAIGPVEVGEEVQIFGPQLPIQEVAENRGTIPYEILTSVGGRVKRIFHAGSI